VRSFVLILAIASIGCSSDDESCRFTTVPTCEYRGYGTTCDVPCSFGGGCPFALRVQWTSCCGAETYEYCSCVDGLVMCRDQANGAPHKPTSRCEFCK